MADSSRTNLSPLAKIVKSINISIIDLSLRYQSHFMLPIRYHQLFQLRVYVQIHEALRDLHQQHYPYSVDKFSTSEAP